MNKNDQTKGTSAIIAAAFFFAAGPLLVSNLEAHPLSIVLVGTFFAALSLVIYKIIKGEKIRFPKKNKKELIIIGLIHGFIMLSYYYALQHLSFSLAIITMYLGPLWMLFISKAINKTKIEKKSLLATGIGIIGVAAVVLGSVDSLSFHLPSFLAVLAGSFGFAYVYVIAKKIDYKPTEITLYQNSIAFPLILILVLILKVPMTVNSVAIGSVIGVVGIAIAFNLAFYGFKKLPIKKANTLTIIDPIVPIVLAWIVFGDAMNIQQILGTVAVIVSNFIVN